MDISEIPGGVYVSGQGYDRGVCSVCSVGVDGGVRVCVVCVVWVLMEV